MVGLRIILKIKVYGLAGFQETARYDGRSTEDLKGCVS